ncbi:MAG: V-type ATP synthase subunit E [Anaerocolumna sp.]
MTLDEKLEQFYSAAMDSATSQNIKIIDEYQKSLQIIYDEHKIEALRKAETTYRMEAEKLLREKNRQLSNEVIFLKRKLSERAQELKVNLFEEVAEHIQEFMKTPAYFDLLVKQITEAKEFAGEEEITIYINATDSSLKLNLEANTGAMLTVSKIDFCGGTRAVIHEKNILIDNSFLTKLEESRNSICL